MYIHQDYLDAIALVAQGKINLEGLIANEFELREIALAYQNIADHK